MSEDEDEDEPLPEPSSAFISCVRMSICTLAGAGFCAEVSDCVCASGSMMIFYKHMLIFIAEPIIMTAAEKINSYFQQ